MFKQHPDNMRMEPTPERVYAVCRLVAFQRMSKEQVLEAMSLGEHGSSNRGDINACIAVAADELGILRNRDGTLELDIADSELASPASFRRLVSARVFDRENATFVRFSRWYLAQNEKVFELGSWETRANTAKRDVPELEGIDENAALGWRFWAAFLGLGYLNGTVLIPNMAIRLQDLLASTKESVFSFGEAVQAKVFIDWLAGALPEVFPAENLPLGLSAGLRTLHELELLQLESRRDTARQALYFVDGDPCNDFSHITIREGIGR